MMHLKRNNKIFFYSNILSFPILTICDFHLERNPPPAIKNLVIKKLTALNKKLKDIRTGSWIKGNIDKKYLVSNDDIKDLCHKNISQTQIKYSKFN